jgi:hypothetical protein
VIESAVVEHAVVEPTVVEQTIVEQTVIEPAVVEVAVIETAVVAPQADAPVVVDTAPGETVETAAADAGVTVAPPEVAPELVQDIAAPQYGIGLQLFDAVPEAPARADGDKADEAPKNNA